MMELTLRRIARKDTYTIGRLYIDGEYFCDTIEDKDRGLSQELPVTVNKKLKRAGSTAIPVGRYRVTMDVVSPRFSKKATYQSIGGRLPRLIKVPAFEGVLIHIGNTAKDTEGCILVGKNTAVGKVLNSRTTFFALYERLKQAKGMIYITVQ